MSRLRNPASSMIAAKLSAPRISQTVVSMLDMPPLENRPSIVALPLADSNPLAMAWYTASMPSRTIPWSGSSTNASTAARCVKQARTPENTATPKMPRNGGTLRNVTTTSSTSGNKLSAEMLNAVARTSRASSTPTDDAAGSSTIPMTR